MATQHEMRRERRERDAVAIAALREGASDKVAAEASGLSLKMVGQLRRWLGLKPAHGITPEFEAGTVRTEVQPPTPTRVAAQMRREIVDHLGEHFYRQVVGDDVLALHEAHAAMRCVVVGAVRLIPAVETAMRIQTRAASAERATSTRLWAGVNNVRAKRGGA